MVKPVDSPAAEYIEPLNINGLKGRMLKAPAARKNAKREMLLLYGHHALLERWWGLVQNLQDYGSVTMPDLPGFGGMDSFAKIGRKPTIDNYADYLAAFIKMTYKRRRITIVGISFGFVVATRMLQKYPEMAKRVDLMVSLVGFMHRDDFIWSQRRRNMMRLGTRLFATRPMAFLIRYVGLNRFVIEHLYVGLGGGKRKFLDVDPIEFNTLMEFEVRLWQTNDVRTHWLTTTEFLDIDNCQGSVPLPVLHVRSSNDQYFNNEFVEQHMRVVFTDYEGALMHSKGHTPSVLGDKKELGVMLPPSIRRALRQKP